MQYLIQSGAAGRAAEFQEVDFPANCQRNTRFFCLAIDLYCCIANIEPIQLHRSGMIASVCV
jgi:hypothetical protein